MFKTSGLVFVLFCCANLTFSQIALSEEKLSHIRGTIKRISSDHFSVQGDKGMIEFKRNSENAKLPDDAKVGDNITVWFEAIPHRISIRKHEGGSKEKSGQEPGEVDVIRKHIIIDDRAFYDARNSIRQNEMRKDRKG